MLYVPAYTSLNAPYGARCFLTQNITAQLAANGVEVLMHLMALGAF